MAERRTITVHAFGDERVHLALAHHGRLKQGRLNTLCGKLAVTALSPFAAAAKASERCRVCFGKVDEDGLVKGAVAPPAKAATVVKAAKPKPEPKSEPATAPARKRGRATAGASSTARRPRSSRR